MRTYDEKCVLPFLDPQKAPFTNRSSHNSGNDRYGNVFPRDWRVLHRLALDFAKRTKTMITNILLKIDPPESADVELLLKGLTKTLAFEREAAATFEVSAARQAVLSEDVINDGGQDGMVMDDDGNVIDPNSSEGIQLK